MDPAEQASNFPAQWGQLIPRGKNPSSTLERKPNFLSREGNWASADLPHTMAAVTVITVSARNHSARHAEWRNDELRK